MTLWEDMYDYLLPEINGYNEPLVKFHFRRAAIEFCYDTLVHVVALDPINVVSGTNTYTLTSNVAETDIRQVKSVWFNGYPISDATQDTLASVPIYWRTYSADVAYGYTMNDPNTLSLYPSPSENVTNGLRVDAAIMPSGDSTGVADWLSDHYADDIASGAKARLMAMSGKPWTDREGAAYYLKLFMTSKSNAKAEANRSLTRAALSAVPRPAVR